MIKLDDYLKKQKIDLRRVVAASRDLEALRPEDRVIRLAKKRAKGGDEAAKEIASKKPRSGRPVSGPTIRRALAGGKLSGAAKTRILRALNVVLKTKKKNEAGLRDLF